MEGVDEEVPTVSDGDMERVLMLAMNEEFDTLRDEGGFLLDQVMDARVSTFEADGLMTRAKGLVITLPCGDQFQVTIVQSARGQTPTPERLVRQ